MPPPLPDIPAQRRFAYVGPVLAVIGFAVWTLFSLLTALSDQTAPFRVVEAWDTMPFLQIGIPLVLLVQVAAGAIGGENIFRQPLWMLGGFFVGLLLVHRSGNSFGLLPVTVVLIGVPSYVVLLAAAAIGYGLARWAKRT